MAYTPDSIWRNRDTFLQGRDEIVNFLTQKWVKEKAYRLRKELFAFTDNKVRLPYPTHQPSPLRADKCLPPLSVKDRRPVLVRVARRVWAVVEDVWARGLDVRRERTHAEEADEWE